MLTVEAWSGLEVYRPPYGGKGNPSVLLLAATPSSRVVGGCLDDVWAVAWKGWGLGEQKQKEVERTDKMCSSTDPVFMQMLLLTQRDKGKGHQAV